MSIINLARPIEILMPNIVRQSGRYPTCQYYNERTFAWSTDGVQTQDSGGTTVTCYTNHLSAFAVNNLDRPAPAPTPNNNGSGSGTGNGNGNGNGNGGGSGTASNLFVHVFCLFYLLWGTIIRILGTLKSTNIEWFVLVIMQLVFKIAFK